MDDTHRHENIFDTNDDADVEQFTFDLDNVPVTHYNPFTPNAYSMGPVVDARCTLRIMNRRYSSLSGSASVDTKPEEFSRCVAKDCLAPLRVFTNLYGHFYKETTMAFKPRILQNAVVLLDTFCTTMSDKLSSGFLWDLSGTRIVQRSTISTEWICGGTPVSPELGAFLSRVSAACIDPISAHSWYAAIEASRRPAESVSRVMYPNPQETTRVTGILGTLTNNQTLDMAPEGEESGVPNASARKPKRQELGFICAGHTAHSSEALKVRKVTDMCHIRVLGQDTIQNIKSVSNSIRRRSDMNVSSGGNWIVYAMGLMCHADEGVVRSLWDAYTSQPGEMNSHYTLHMYTTYKVLMYSVSSGVLLKKDINGYTVDSTMIHSADYLSGMETPAFHSKASIQSMYTYFSTFYMFVPFVRYDRPPRTVMASMQSIQGACLPWAAGTSAYAPTYAEMPLVITETLEYIYKETYGTSMPAYLGPMIELADVVPGRSVLTVMANMTYTYEDTAIVNSAAVERGMFVCLVHSVYNISVDEYIPEIGSRITKETCTWWKNTPIVSSSRVLSASPLDSYGTITSVGIPMAGRVSVHIRSVASLQTGDKIATWNGQKYTVYITRAVDMPWFYDDDNNMYTPDIVISTTSMVKRQTNGAAMALMASRDAAKSGSITVGPEDFHEVDILTFESELYDGTTGEQMMRRVGQTMEPVLCTWGFTHFVEQTQKSRDKQHYSHTTSGQHSIKPKKGRSAGGAVNLDEMSTYALHAAGLTSISDELRARSDIVVVLVCNECHLIMPICTCDDVTETTPFALPMNFIVEQLASVIYHNCAVEVYS